MEGRADGAHDTSGASTCFFGEPGKRIVRADGVLRKQRLQARHARRVHRRVHVARRRRCAAGGDA